MKTNTKMHTSKLNQTAIIELNNMLERLPENQRLMVKREFYWRYFERGDEAWSWLVNRVI
ncbi:MAG: hypothetical protein QM504_10400 [Pseudomonadota bacterium]